MISLFFFFNYTATPEIYTLSLHDALPISLFCGRGRSSRRHAALRRFRGKRRSTPAARVYSPGNKRERDRKSTRLNSSHLGISYAVFCLKKKKKKHKLLFLSGYDILDLHYL